MKNGMKQLFRTPLKTGMLFLLLVLGSALFTIGMILWIQVTGSLDAADKSFVTIATVTQKENSMSSRAQWDAALKDNIYFDEPIYSEIFTTDILQDSGVEFVSGPEQRPYYGAVSPDLTAMRPEDRGYGTGGFIGEIRPLEDCVPDRPVKVKVEKVLWGEQQLVGSTVFFCDHRNEHPREMKSAHSYFAYFVQNAFNFDKHPELQGSLEYIPAVKAYQEQPQTLYEVSDGFYEAGEGKIWMDIITCLDREWEYLPVTPTSDLQLVHAFHEGEAVITDGRTITEKEFAEGKRVCLIPQRLVELNQLKVGDSFELQFYFADYKNAPSQVANTEGGLNVYALRPDGKPYEVFQTGEYKVVGIYSYPVVLTDNPYALGTNQIFIPSASVTESDKNHILEQGPMQGFNTSFRIKNGIVSQVMEKINRLPESKFLELQIYDNGYEQIVSGLEGTRIIAAVLFVAGLALSLAVITFILYFTVVRQKRRMAIERALGTSRKRCIYSLLSGVLLLTVTGLLAGVAAGDFMAKRVQKMADSQTEFFDMTYTRGIGSEQAAKVDYEADNSDILVYEGITVVIGTGFTGILSLYLIWQNLKIAPIYLLGRREE